MALQLILGNTGSGKTTYAYEVMKKRSQEENTREFYIVPEQFTMQAQEEMIQMSKCHGIMNVEVLSFNRLIYRFYDYLNLSNKKAVSENGRALIIRRIIEKHLDEFTWIKKHRKKQNYMEELNRLVSECSQYNVTEERLIQFIDRVDEPLLKDKLIDLKLLLKYYGEEIKEDFITVNDAALKLIEMIPNIELIEKVNITLDAFYGFTPIQYQVIEALLKSVNHMQVCITIDTEEKLGDMSNESALFFESKKMISRLRDVAQKVLAEESEPVLLKEIKRKQKKELIFLTKHLLRYPTVAYKAEDKTEGIRFVEAANIDVELDLICQRIYQLVDHGARFKDITVLVSDLNMYENKIKTYFSDYEFSFFMDKKDHVAAHPLIQFILSALLTVSHGFKYEHLFNHVKSIYYEQTDALNRIENYCIRNGVQGVKKWEQTWDDLNEEKGLLTNKLFELRGRVIGGNTVGEKINALFDYLEACEVEKINGDIFESIKTSDLEAAKLYERILPMVAEFLEDTNQLIGDEKVSVKEFANLIETGLLTLKFAQTPPSIDQIVVGDLSRTRFKENKYIFILGVNDQKVPLVLNQNQLLTDRERTSLMELGLEMAPNQAVSLFKEQMNLYTAMTKGTHMLHLSYLRLHEDGIMRPAPLMYTLFKHFPGVQVEDGAQIVKESKLVTRKVPMFERLTNMLASEIDRENEILIKENFAYFVKEFKKNKLVLNPYLLLDGLKYKNKAENIEPINVGNHAISVSQLESYSSCAYAHYLNYHLKLQERQAFEVTPPNIGNLFHKCLELYMKKCLSRKVDMANPGDQCRNQLIEEAVEEVVSEKGNIIFKSSARNQYLVLKLTRILRRAVWGIENQLKKGVFRPKELEFKFDGKHNNLESLKLEIKPKKYLFLRGIIDRVDEFETDDKIYISIIDYKSSKKELNFGLIDGGLQLQLLVYLKVAKEIKENSTNKEVVPSGLYYYQIQDPFVEDAGEDSETLLLKALRPTGLVLHDNEVIHFYDQEIDGASTVIPVTIGKKGINKSSKTITKEALDVTIDFVTKKTIEIGKKVYDGHVSINPVEYDNRRPCEYCEFESVCRFDPTNKDENCRKIDKKSMEDIIKKWEGEQ